MFDHTTITVTDYYFVVDARGTAWTDTANRGTAVRVADTLAGTQGVAFRVFDHSGAVHTTAG